MDNLSAKDLSELMTHRLAQCLSLYMPTHPTGPEAQQDAVRLKNLCDKGDKLLVEHGMRAAEARELVQTVRNIPHDPVFWMHRSAGLAVFLSREMYRVYRLGWPFEEQVTVNRRFHVKQLLPLLRNAEYYVLDLNRREPALFRGNRFQLTRVHVPNMPGHFEEVLNYVPPDGGTQVHSSVYGPFHKKQAGVFHGQGGVKETAKEDIVKYLRQVDAALHPILNNEARPLVLVAVDYVIPLFRSVCRYPHLLDDAVTGNAEHWPDSQLHQKTWPLIERRLQERQQAAVARFRQLHGTGKATDNLVELLPAATVGQVDTLLVYPPAQVWGIFEPGQQRLEQHPQPQPGDDDLVDLAVAETLKHAGTVLPLRKEELPTDSVIAAIFRY